MKTHVTSTFRLREFLKVCPNSPCEIFRSKSGEHVLFQIKHKDIDWERNYDFNHFLNQTKKDTYNNNRLAQFIKLAKITPEEVDEFINCFDYEE